MSIRLVLIVAVRKQVDPRDRKLTQSITKFYALFLSKVSDTGQTVRVGRPIVCCNVKLIFLQKISLNDPDFQLVVINYSFL